MRYKAGDLIGNQIADKITSHSKEYSNELPNDETEVDIEKSTKRKYIHHQKKDNK